MPALNKEELLLRTARANPAQLVVVAYEIITGSLSAAADSDGADFDENVERARNGITQLIGGLNFSEEFAWTLYDIYVYVYGRLTRAHIRRDRGAVSESLSLMGSLREGFEAAAQSGEADAGAQKTGAPSVYAGLTYERDGLSEFVVQDDERGFKA